MERQILKLIKKVGKITLNELLEYFQIETSSPKGIKKYNKILKTLSQLEKKNIIIKNKKYYNYNADFDKPKTLIGKFQLKTIEYGFVLNQQKNGNDVFIVNKDFNGAFDDDLVEVEIYTDKKRGKNQQGKVIKIIEKSQKKYKGVLRKSGSQVFVTVNTPYTTIVYPTHKIAKNTADNTPVIVKDLSFFKKSKKIMCTIDKYLSNIPSNENHILEIVSEANLRYEFPEAVLKEAQAVSATIPKEEIEQRLDLRNEIIFTIDPFDAKDFDDAVSLKELENGNYLLGVHIADVSHYVKPGTPLDKEAYLRGNSVYLVGKCIPMLPEELSNEICSLNPNEDRLTYSALIELSPKGTVKKYSFQKTIINSKRRFTYEEAQAILETGKGDFADILLKMNKLAKQLKKKRIYAGGLEFSSSEVIFKLDNTGKPLEVTKKVLKDSNFLIEEFMLLANKCVATFIGDKLKKFNLPFVYRIHEEPDFAKVQELSFFLNKLGYKYPPEFLMKSEGIQKLLMEIEGKEEEPLINDVMIRSMAKAIYSPENLGHFGLGFKFYTHFTSPIRRYADLVVHRLLFDYSKVAIQSLYSENKLKDICAHISETEKIAQDAERKSVKIKQIEYLQDFVGETFEGIISGVLNFGFFVELIDTLAEGLVHINELEGDYYYFDSSQYAIIGKRTKKMFRLGDKVKVQLIRVDMIKRTMNFILVE
ncbi:MAG: ribonuclease R [Bacteroidales bacterium]|nr:ribonuclease R [Bacteroidales bacterium]